MGPCKKKCEQNKMIEIKRMGCRYNGWEPGIIAVGMIFPAEKQHLGLK